MTPEEIHELTTHEVGGKHLHGALIAAIIAEKNAKDAIEESNIMTYKQKLEQLEDAIRQAYDLGKLQYREIMDDSVALPLFDAMNNSYRRKRN